MDQETPLRRYRVSDRLSGNTTAYFEGKLDRRFYPYFDYLLDSEHSPEENSHFYNIYVQNAPLEEKIRKRLTSPVSQITAITGARGIGKSTSMRYFFGVSTQPKLLNLSQIVQAEYLTGSDDSCLIVPFYLDTATLTPDNVTRLVTSQVQAAAEFLANESSLEFTDEAIFDFVKTHKNSLVTFPKLPLNASVSERMEYFRENNTYGYVTELLKYSLYKSNTPRVVLIVDDIESCDFQIQKEIVKGVLKLRDCLKNFGTLSRCYVPNFFFTCRPATFKMLKIDPEIDGFSVRHPIDLSEPASLSKIVEKRFEYALKMVGEGKVLNSMGNLADVENRDSWEEAYKSFRAIIGRLSTYNEAMIVELCNQDVRRALMDVQEMLRNSRWYERGPSHVQGAIDVEIGDFDFGSSGLIRALVLRDHEFYSEEIDTVVPNLFHNFEDSEADLMLQFVIKIFFEKTRSKRVAPIKKSEIKSLLKICYDKPTIDAYFEEVYSYAKEYEILREEIVRSANGRRITYVVPLTKGFRLWKACKLGSVFLEFFRDNTFLEHRLVKEFPLARSKGTSSLPDLHKFVLCADFISEVSKTELRIVNRISKNGELEKYLKNFGGRSISRHIYWGLRNSLRRRYPGAKGITGYDKVLRRPLSRADSASRRVDRNLKPTQNSRT